VNDFVKFGKSNDIHIIQNHASLSLDKNKPYKVSPCWYTLFPNALQAFSIIIIIIIIIIKNKVVVNVFPINRRIEIRM
jgi:hypothetical protein